MNTSKLVYRLLGIVILSSFLMFGAFGFMIMLQPDGNMMANSDCPIGGVNPDCPVSLFTHIRAWRGITFNFSQIILILSINSIVYFYLIFSRNPILLLLHKIRDWISKNISKIEILYSQLFSDGILNSKLYLLIA